MCLKITEHWEQETKDFILKSDKIVKGYKLIKRTEPEENIINYDSVYQNFPYLIGKIYDSNRIEELELNEKEKITKEIHIGFHFFQNIEKSYACGKINCATTIGNRYLYKGYNPENYRSCPFYNHIYRDPFTDIKWAEFDIERDDIVSVGTFDEPKFKSFVATKCKMIKIIE